MPGVHLSATEKKLLHKWEVNNTSFDLQALSLSGDPGLRGIKNLNIEFNYPLSAICGKNGSGKTTLLVLSALGYHTIHKHIPRGVPYGQVSGDGTAYYTFRNFFYKGPLDPDFTGINISWKFKNGQKLNITKRSEKWMHYERRPKRAVHYLGVSRAVPAIELNVLKNHFYFGSTPTGVVKLNDEYRDRLSDIMGRKYTSADELHSKSYSIRTCSAGSPYSSFNMGAGEDILIDMLELFQSSPNDALIVIEEIELGIHPAALRRLAAHLIDILNANSMQVIISTHSREFYDAIPSRARILIQPYSSGHDVLYGTTTRFAMGEINDKYEPELCIYCEDQIAESIIRYSMSGQQCKRTKLIAIGDKYSLYVQGIAHIRSKSATKHLVIWDGDVQNSEVTNWSKKFEIGIESLCYCFLPTDLPPEKMILSLINNEAGIKSFSNEFSISEAQASGIIYRLCSITEHHDILHALDEF